VSEVTLESLVVDNDLPKPLSQTQCLGVVGIALVTVTNKNSPDVGLDILQM
jgi:hypothetical protein